MSPASAHQFDGATSQRGVAFVLSIWIVWAASVAGLILAPSWVPHAPAGPRPVQTLFAPDAAGRVDHWLAPLAAGRDGFRLDHAEVLQSALIVRLKGPGDRDAGTLMLRTFAAGEPFAAREASRSFGIEWYDRSGAEAARSLLADAARLVADTDDGSPVLSVAPLPRALVPESFRWAGIALLVAAALLTLRDRLRLPMPRDVVIKRTHLLPIAIQLTIAGYWAAHYPPVFPQAILVLAQLMFAFVLDSLMAWALRRPWPGPFAMVAPVLSVNLFVWFGGTDLWESFLVIALAIASKALIRRNGRHIFNPSAFGLTIVGVLATTARQTFGYQDIAFALASGPNMPEVMFLATLVPLLLLRTVPIALGAALAMQAIQFPGSPSFAWPGWFLAVTIFAGDPATAPRSTGGRFLFGLFVGACIQGAAAILFALAGTDFWAKVMRIPIANLLVPLFERAGERLDAVVSGVAARLPRTIAGAFRTPALACAALWAFIFLANLPGTKRSLHAPAHWEWRSPLLCAVPNGPVTCAENRAFCEPFSFILEGRAWASRPQNRCRS